MNKPMLKMPRRRALATAVGAFVLSIAGAAAAQDTTTEAADNEEENIVYLEPLIVTAQKRPEVLADVPQSITVLTDETLERRHADDFEDLQSLIPGFSLDSTQPGASHITLRGVNTGGPAATVSVYVDETPFGSSTGLASGAFLAGDFDTFDIARIEVLRGPQGTLYGASSLGGLLKYVTNPPSTEGVEFKAQVGVETVEGGDLGYSAKSVANLPLTDTIAVRASAFYRQEDGYVDSIGNNPIPSLLFPGVNIVDGTRVDDNINDLEVYGGRVSGLFQPSDNFSVRLTALSQDIKSGAPNNYEGDPVTLAPLYGGLVQSQYHSEFQDVKYRLYSATIDWDFGAARLLSSTSYGTLNQHFQFDSATQLAQTVNLLAAFGLLTGTPVLRPLSVITDLGASTEKFTQELRLSSPENDRLEWILGLFYTRENSQLGPQALLAVEAGTDTVAQDIPVLATASVDSTYREYAGFANATWHIAPRFDLTFGGRLSRNEQVASEFADSTVLGGVITAFDNRRSSEDVFTWSVAPRFELNDEASIYVRVATGYRPGGPNILPVNAPPGLPATFDSDTLTSYEVGLKGAWLDRTLSLDVAVYHLDWNDVQFTSTINDVTILDNGGDAAVDGAEFTVALRPMQDLTLSLNAAYTDARLTENTNPEDPDASQGFDGDRLPYVPKWSAALSGDYEWSLNNGAYAYVGATYSMVDDRKAELGQRAPDGSLREVPGYETFDVRAGVDFGRWSVEAYVRNLGNERGVTYVFGEDRVSIPNGAIGASIIRPRTIGLTIGTRF